MKPTAIDLFCGLGGWTDGLLAEGWNVVGFDVERHVYPTVVTGDGGSVKRPGMSWSGSDKPGYKAVAFNATPDVMGGSPAKWRETAEPLVSEILPLSPEQSKRAFLARYRVLLAVGANGAVAKCDRCEPEGNRTK